MPEAGGGGGWNLGRKDGVYAALLALTFGGERVLDRPDPQLATINGQISVLVEKVTSLERNVGQLQDPGGPVLRQTVAQVKNHEELIHELQAQLRGGVSKESIDEVKQRLAEGRDSDKDMRAQIENLRNSVDGLRLEIQRAMSARLVGPGR